MHTGQKRHGDAFAHAHRGWQFGRAGVMAARLPIQVGPFVAGAERDDRRIGLPVHAKGGDFGVVRVRGDNQNSRVGRQIVLKQKQLGVAAPAQVRCRREVHALFGLRRFGEIRRHVEKSLARDAAFKRLRPGDAATLNIQAWIAPAAAPGCRGRKQQDGRIELPIDFRPIETMIVQRDHSAGAAQSLINRNGNRRADCTARTVDMPSCAPRESAPWRSEPRCRQLLPQAAIAGSARLTRERELQPARRCIRSAAIQQTVCETGMPRRALSPLKQWMLRIWSAILLIVAYARKRMARCVGRPNER